MLKDLLDAKGCFKLICGAGNEDPVEVEKLVFLYAKAGCKFFDLSASEDVIDAAKRGMTRAGVCDAYICVSVGIAGDPHVRKAFIDYEKCTGCGKCDEICPENAIKYHKVNKTKCLGCSRCAKYCSSNAISFTDEPKDLNSVLPVLIAKGIDCVELHAMGEDEEEVQRKWEFISDNFDGMLSICTSRGKLSDEKLVNRIKKLTQKRKPFTTVIQADGFPMSGGKDDYKTTLQAVATAEIVQNESLPVYLLLSGGTNSKSAKLAKLCGINANGTAAGSFARKIVRKYIEREDFFTNPRIIDEAVDIARALVNSAK